MTLQLRERYVDLRSYGESTVNTAKHVTKNIFFSEGVPLRPKNRQDDLQAKFDQCVFSWTHTLQDWIRF